MTKLSLISLHSVQNYGSVLQAFASERYLSRFGFEVESVDYVRENNLRENLVETALMNSRFKSKGVLARALFRAVKYGDLKRRYDLFDRFIKENLHLTPFRYTRDEQFAEHPVDADIYCTGSDQTWNTYWNRGFLAPYYLSFARAGAKKISFAASFGKSALDGEEAEKTRELLSCYDFITVREQSGVDILGKMGICSKRVLDPTLMLERDEWLKYTKKPKLKSGYLLVYRLNYDSTFDKCALRLAREKGLRLVRIGLGKDAYLCGGKAVLSPDVFDFVSLIANAEYVMTDSFHAACFAVNFNVQLFVYPPRLFAGRITDFLELFGLGDRVFDSYEALLAAFGKRIDFDRVNALLAAERRRCERIVFEMTGCAT